MTGRRTLIQRAASSPPVGGTPGVVVVSLDNGNVDQRSTSQPRIGASGRLLNLVTNGTNTLAQVFLNDALELDSSVTNITGTNILGGTITGTSNYYHAGDVSGPKIYGFDASLNVTSDDLVRADGHAIFAPWEDASRSAVGAVIQYNFVPRFWNEFDAPTLKPKTYNTLTMTLDGAADTLIQIYRMLPLEDGVHCLIVGTGTFPATSVMFVLRINMITGVSVAHNLWAVGEPRSLVCTLTVNGLIMAYTESPTGNLNVVLLDPVSLAVVGAARTTNTMDRRVTFQDINYHDNYYYLVQKDYNSQGLQYWKFNSDLSVNILLNTAGMTVGGSNLLQTYGHLMLSQGLVTIEQRGIVDASGQFKFFFVVLPDDWSTVPGSTWACAPNLGFGTIPWVTAPNSITSLTGTVVVNIETIPSGDFSILPAPTTPDTLTRIRCDMS